MSTRSNSFHLCIVGCGGFARAHAAAIRDMPGVRFSFASRERAKAEAYVQQFGGTAAFGAYEEAAGSGQMDGLLFCTPHYIHRQGWELALAHRKPVLMEKPIATTLPDALEMARAARQAGVAAMVAENALYMPVVQEAARLLRDGTIGRLLSVHIHEDKWQHPDGWRLSKVKMGGGALLDGGIHKLAVLRLLAGDPQTVAAVAHAKLFPEMEGEEGASLWATFQGGVVGTLTYTWNSPREQSSQWCVIVGDRGRMDFEFYGSRVTVRSGGEVRTHSVEGDPRGMRQMHQAFIDLVRDGTQPPSSPREAVRDLGFALAAYASIEGKGKVVTVHLSDQSR